MSTSQSYVAITRLMASRCKTEYPNPDTIDISDAADSNRVDWAVLYRLADLHDLVPLVYKALLIMGYEGIPDAHITPFRIKYEENRTRNLVLCDELLFIIKKLRQRSIEIIPYKEPLSFSLTHSDIAERQFKDVDFLVNLSDLDGIHSVLSSLDYRLEQSIRCFRNPCYERVAKNYSYVRETAWTTGRPVPESRNLNQKKAGWVILEPHWSIAPSRLAVNLPVHDLRYRLVSLEYKGEPINLLSPEDAHLVTCIVGSKSEWRSLKLIADVAASLEASPSLDWEWCLQKARDAKALQMFLLGNLLAARIADARVSKSVYDIAIRDKTVVNMADDIQHHILDDSFSNRIDPRKFSNRIFKLREHRKDRLHYLVATFTTPSETDIRRLPLPRSLYFIYWFTVPLSTYLILPAARWLRDRFQGIR